MKMSDLHIELTADTDVSARKARIISKHLAAMADELELAKGLEPDKCDYCGRAIYASLDAWQKGDRLYCSKGCMEMAGMEPRDQHIHIVGVAGDMDELVDKVRLRLEQALPVRSGCGARWPSGTWGQSCLKHCTCIDKVVDTVILRLRDSFGLEI